MARLPPLNALRAFEAAGRHLSFTRAAQELNVTQAAISHQIKSLEEYLGIRLFRRQNRGLLLTDAGQAYLPDVRRAFERLATATDKLQARDASGVLTVSVLPSFGAKWLVPRLARFRLAHPEIDVRLSASEALVDFTRDDVDVAIRHGQGHYPGLSVTPLMREVAFAVCSPALLTGPHPIRTPEDLRRHTLLHDDDETTWAMWLRAAGVDTIDPTRGPFFDDSSMTLHAAVNGQGVALGRSALAHDDLKAGRLVRLFDISLPCRAAYYLVYPEHTASRPKIQAFRQWLLDETGGDDAGRAVHEPAVTTPVSADGTPS